MFCSTFDDCCVNKPSNAMFVDAYIIAPIFVLGFLCNHIKYFCQCIFFSFRHAF